MYVWMYDICTYHMDGVCVLWCCVYDEQYIYVCICKLLSSHAHISSYIYIYNLYVCMYDMCIAILTDTFPLFRFTAVYRKEEGGPIVSHSSDKRDRDRECRIVVDLLRKLLLMQPKKFDCNGRSRLIHRRHQNIGNDFERSRQSCWLRIGYKLGRKRKVRRRRRKRRKIRRVNWRSSISLWKKNGHDQELEVIDM
jgi:hypothetical protein